ncbi:MAG: zf-HC2 domain-containing protein [Acidobacteriota bacterium]
MTNPRPRDGGDASFERDFGAGFDALRRRKRDCPRAEVLASYLGGEASEEESAEVRRHLAACGVCDLLVERMKAFERDPHPGPGKRVLGWLRTPAFAYALVALLLYPAYMGTLGRRRAAEVKPAVPRQPPLGVEPAKVLELSPERGAKVQVSPGERDKVFVLSFFVPVREGVWYTATITGEDGKAVAAPRQLEDHDGAGNFHLVCSRDLFRPGRYVLTVTESGGRTFSFPFSL